MGTVLQYASFVNFNLKKVYLIIKKKKIKKWLYFICKNIHVTKNQRRISKSSLIRDQSAKNIINRDTYANKNNKKLKIFTVFQNLGGGGGCNSFKLISSGLLVLQPCNFILEPTLKSGDFLHYENIYSTNNLIKDSTF